MFVKHEKRTERIPVRVTKGEKEILEGFAKATGMPVSTLLRDRALKTKIEVRRERVEVLKLVEQLARIGNNVNQIAKHLNSGRMGSMALLDALGEVKNEFQAIRDYSLESAGK